MSVQHTKTTHAIRRTIGVFEIIGLVIIALATIYAGFTEVTHMVRTATVTLGDLLLLFLYLEVLAMVAIYLDSGKLPIRLPLYIAIIAMARYLILEMKELSEWEMLAVGFTIILIALAVLALRYGSLKFPSQDRLGPRWIAAQPIKNPIGDQDGRTDDLLENDDDSARKPHQQQRITEGHRRNRRRRPKPNQQPDSAAE
ncbi:phosphate-starvation-inducible E [Thiomicrospira aerophila AL3]|uniref:Protein PsiE n=1 Tax=Thiomicrospira aerophila AL3 TaxID=717772 RepID=W0DT44_9GAMM|nr:phosphate-starvation-inducible PsiE family protein [Thiomicrospira aerophila]AHF00448.1 phosphate-starvation-inducible E [Thiomicrospira aerophila AL3]